jgi:hypothetical protein
MAKTKRIYKRRESIMPNYVKNTISLQGDKEKIQEMFEAIKNDTCGIGTIDFNKVIPMPETLDIESGSRTDRGLKAYKDFVSIYLLNKDINGVDLLNIPLESEKLFLDMRTDIKNDEWQLGRTAFQNIQKYGAPTWYEWSINNWGTKWNACGYYTDTDYSESDKLCFETAWSAPHPILEKLSEMYPEIRFEHEWADEDLGNNCGRCVYLGGETIEEYYPENLKEGMDLALSLWEYDPEDLGLMVNKSGTDFINVNSRNYDQIELLGKTMLFSNNRITENDIPEGLFCYDLRYNDDNDKFASLEPKVTVNHAGSVITNEPIDFGEQGYIALTEETSPNFVNNDVTIGEYMRDELPQDESQGMEML